MKSIKMFLICAAFLGGALCLSTASAGESIEPKALFEQKCQACHELDLPKSQQLDRSGWEAILNWMTSMADANINDREYAIILDYLVENYGP